MTEDRRVETVLALSATAKSTRYRLYQSEPVSRARGNQFLKGALLSHPECRSRGKSNHHNRSSTDAALGAIRGTTGDTQMVQRCCFGCGGLHQIKGEINVSICVLRVAPILNPLPTNLPTYQPTSSLTLVYFAIIVPLLSPPHRMHAHNPSGMPHLTVDT